MNGDQTLKSLSEASDSIHELEAKLEAARKVRDRLIVSAVNAKLEGYRKLAKRCHLTPGRIQQVVEEQRRLERLFGKRD